MKLLKGMFRDCNPHDQPDGTWRLGVDTIWSRLKNCLTNEDNIDWPIIGTNQYNAAFDIKDIVGHCVFPDESAVLFIYNSTQNKHQIAILGADDTYTTLLSDTQLNFSYNYPIRATGTYDANGNRIVAWVNSQNKPCILNVDSLPFTPGVGLSIPDITLLYLFSEYTYPVNNNSDFATVVEGGGSILSGSYSIFFAYEDSVGARTNYTLPFGQYAVARESYNLPFENVDGCAANTVTSKSLKITVNSSDLRYKYLVIGILATNNGIKTAKIVGKIATSNVTAVFNYTGGQFIEDVALDEVLVPTASYKSASDIVSYKDTLYLAGLQVDTDANLQQYANQIVVNYRSTLVNTPTLSNSNKIGSNKKGFMHDQPYALYIAGILANGKITKLFHIPGRAPKTGETDTVTTGGVTGKKYQIQDTCDANGQSYASTTDSLGRPVRLVNDHSVSNMGYWENEDEYYPATFPSGLANQRIRHHKFPSLSRMGNAFWTGSYRYGCDNIDLLTLDISNVLLTAVTPAVVRWLIFAAKVDSTNAAVLCQDLALFSAKQNNNLTVIWSSAGNWNTTNLPTATDGYTMDTTYLRLHSFDLLKNKMAVSPDYVTMEALLYKTGLNKDFTVFGKAGGAISRSGSDYGYTPTAVIDYTDSNGSAVSGALPTNNGTYYRAITSFKYLGNNITDTDKNNQGCEECGIATLASAFGIIAATKMYVCNNVNGGLLPLFNGADEEHTALISVKSLKKNLFTPYNAQDVFQCSKAPQDVGISFAYDIEGDCYASCNSFITTTQLDSRTTSISNVWGIFAFRQHSVITRSNVGLRYEDTAIQGTKYYPKTQPTSFILNRNSTNAKLAFDKTQINQIAYNNDYTSLNDAFSVKIWHPDDKFYSSFPNRVVKSGTISRNVNNIMASWKKFLDQDIYESNYDKGPINNLAVAGDILFIHHKYSLFKTVASQRLKAEVTEVFLGTTTNLFDIAPKEQITDPRGYIGSQHKFANFVFKDNYFCVDASQGKAFLINISSGQIEEISGKGMDNDFLTYFKRTTADKPGYDGIQACYDPLYERIMLYRNSSDGYSIGLTYSMIINAWVSFCNYIPTYIFNTRNKVFSIYNHSQLVKHNLRDRGEKGQPFGPYVSARQPMIIGFVINPESGKDKQFHQISWSDVFEKINNPAKPYESTGLAKNRTFDTIRLKTSYQDSGEITIVPFVNFNNRGNTRHENNNWNFNKLRDKYTQNVSFLQKGYLVDQYLYVELKHNNEKNSDLTPNNVYLLSVDCKSSPAER